MSYDWDGLREEAFDLCLRQNLSLAQTSETSNKRYGPDIRNRSSGEKLKEWKLKRVDQRGRRRGKGGAKVRRSTASSDDSSRRPPSFANYRLNDKDENCGCPHRFTTEESAQISSLKTPHKCWARHRTALSEVSKTEGSEGSDPMETSDAELHSESESGSAVSGEWTRIRALGLETSESAERGEFSMRTTVLPRDRCRWQMHKTFRVTSVDSLLQGIQVEKNRREGCGIQSEGQNDDLEYGKRVLEAWKVKSEMDSSVKIHFITKTIAGQDAVRQSSAEVHQVLQGIGVCRDLDIDNAGGPPDAGIDDEQPSEQIIHDLLLDLRRNAQHSRLLLVCSIYHISFLEKALLRMSSSWLNDRILGLLTLDSSDLTPAYRGSRRASRFKSDNSKSRYARRPRIRPPGWPLSQSCTFALAKAVPQSIQIHILRGTNHRGAANHSCPAVAWLPSISNPSKVGRRQRDIWCHSQEYPDCVSWSIEGLLEGDAASGIAVNLNSQTPGTREKLENRLFLGYLELNTFDGENAARASLTLKALRWIAFSFQPLGFDELFAALASKPAASKAKRSDGQRGKVMLKTTDDLIRLSLGLLRTDEKGFVEFCDHEVKNLVLQTESSFLNPCKPSKVHEMIAMDCMDHLRCLHPQSFFRPWISANILLTEEAECCRLKRYSTAWWHEHFRIAQGDSEYLPSMLDEAIQSAIAHTGALQSSIGAFQELRINLGLWICCLYDLDSVGKTYLQMGAKVGLRYPLGKSLLHIAAANASPNMLKLLLEAGADSKSLDAEGLNVLHCGSKSESSEVMSILTGRQAVSGNEDSAGTHTSACWCLGRVCNWSTTKSPSEVGPRQDSHMVSSDDTGFNAAIALDDPSCVHHLLEFGGERSMTGEVGEGVSELEIGQSRSSTTGSPFWNEGSVLPASDSYPDDWLLVD